MDRYDFFLKLIGAFGGLAAIIIAVLAWNKDRFKIRIQDGAVQRKEVADVLQKLYEDLRGEMAQQRTDHKAEIENLKEEHNTQIQTIVSRSALQINVLYAIIKKKDAIIRELVYRLPPEARAAVQATIDTIEAEISILEGSAERRSETDIKNNA